MHNPTVKQHQAPLSGLAAESAAAAADRARARARAAYALRDARHRRDGQAVIAALILKLSGRRR